MIHLSQLHSGKYGSLLLIPARVLIKRLACFLLGRTNCSNKAMHSFQSHCTNFEMKCPLESATLGERIQEIS